MEYVQMTLNDWMSMKNELEQELRNAAAGFVRIGYLLRRIEEQEGYKKDGYKTLAEWALHNYGLSASQVSRFKKINERYSIDGYSKQLKLEYANYGQSKLTEMLALSDEGLEMVSPEMKREDIREIKAFEKQAPTDGPDDKNQWIVEYINAKGLERLAETKAYKDDNLTAMIEEVIPSGAGTFRFQKIMVSMFPAKIMVREFPNPPENMAWSDFFKVVRAELERRAEEKALEAEQEMPADTEEMPETESEMPAEEQKVPTEGDKKPVNEPEIHKESATEEPAPAEDPADEQPAAGTAEKETIAPAQKEAPAIEKTNVKPDPETAENQSPEEPEQVEIDEILPPPVEQDPMRDLKDRFTAEMNSLKIMLDCDNFAGMAQTIERLEHLRIKMVGLAATAE